MATLNGSRFVTSDEKEPIVSDDLMTPNGEGIALDYAKLMTPQEVALCYGIAERACAIYKAAQESGHGNPSIVLDPYVMAMDIATVHIRRRLNLLALYRSETMALAAEVATIVRHVNRPLASFPDSVRLAFAISANGSDRLIRH